MSSIWTRSLKSSPQYDCGLCGYPKCASFTRAAIVDLIDLERCPVLSLPSFKEARDDLQTLITRKTGLRLRTATELPEGGIVLTRPCKDTDQKVMAELRVHNGVEAGEKIHFGVFDSILLCELSECLISEFEEVKCSKELGYGRVDTGEMSITLLQDGRVNMRRVDNKKQVKAVFDTIERTILGATVCNCCGNDLISIASGLVQSQDQHTVLKCGSSIKLDCDILKEPLTNSLFNETFNDSRLLSEINVISESLLQDIMNLSKQKAQLNTTIPANLSCRLIPLVNHDDTKRKQSILLRMMGYLWILETVMNAIKRIDKLLEEADISDENILKEIISSVIDDIHIEQPSTKYESLFKIFALSRCLLRGKKAIETWLTK